MALDCDRRGDLDHSIRQVGGHRRWRKADSNRRYRASRPSSWFSFAPKFPVSITTMMWKKCFWSWRGRFRVEFRERIVALGPGELVIVPRGVEHRTAAEVILLEPAGILNTGNVIDEKFTAPMVSRTRTSSGHVKRRSR
jgi:hypothetical protein